MVKFLIFREFFNNIQKYNNKIENLSIYNNHFQNISLKKNSIKKYSSIQQNFTTPKWGI